MPTLSSAAYLHLLDKSQKIVRNINTVLFFPWFTWRHLNYCILRTVSRSWSAVGGGCSRAWRYLWRVNLPWAGHCMGEDVSGRGLATNLLSLYKRIKQQCISFPMLGKCNEVSIMWWPSVLWYLISESLKSLLFVNRPLSCRQRDTYTANKH